MKQDTIDNRVYSEIRRYKLENSKRSDYLSIVRQFFDRCKARGWSPTLLREWFMDAANKLETPTPRIRDDVDPSKRLFVHIKYHPKGISHRQLREAFDTTCDNFRGTAAAVDQMTVAFSRPTNLKDELTSARFYRRGDGSTNAPT